jgi:hypothetical protein
MKQRVDIFAGNSEVLVRFLTLFKTTFTTVFIINNKCTIIYHNSISLYNMYSYMF